MPFYIKKSVSAGPFRFNFSKSGVGVSVGVKGLRLGTGPRGHYIHAGRGGFYYRATLVNAGKGRKSAVSPQPPPLPRAMFDSDNIAMIEIKSGDVMHMRDTSFSELLDEINSKSKQTRMSVAFSWSAIVFGIIAGAATGGPGLFFCAVALPAGAVGKWLDSYRRTTVLYYDLEGAAEAAYCRLAEGFDGLVGCATKWHIASGGVIHDLTTWKRNAGASYLVNRKPTTVTYALPAVIKCNVNPPALHAGKQVMFFMPDMVLVQEGSRVGAVSYADLNIQWQDSRFIETESLPNDARVVDNTWKYPNKSGGPDKRFKNNRQLPICLYEAMHLTSNSGVNELLEFSKTGVVSAFVDGCRMLAALPREKVPLLEPLVASASDAVNVVPVNRIEGKRSPFKSVLLIVLGALVGISALAVFRSVDKNSVSVLPPHLPTEISGTLATVTKDPTLPEKAGVKPAPQVTTVVNTAAAVVQSQTIAKEEAHQDTIRYTKTAVNLREGPSTTFPVIIVVPKGAAVSVVATKGEWSHVQVNANSSGWMANSMIAEH